MTVQSVPDYYCSTVYMYSIRSGEFRLLSLVVGIQGWGEYSTNIWTRTILKVNCSGKKAVICVHESCSLQDIGS